MKPVTPTTLRSTESSVRTPALNAKGAQSEPASGRDGVAHRFLNALMRALASPHI